MRKIAVINQKGGVGKTTTVVNLAAALASMNKKVLILDLDPQGNLNTNLMVYPSKDMYHLLIGEAKPEECIVHVNENLHIIPSDRKLSKAELIMAGMTARETILRRAMEDVYGYDYVLIDCPPSINLLNQNALLYANEAFIPVATEYLALDALRKMEYTIQEINEIFNHNIKITMIIPTLYDKRIKSSVRILSEIKKGFNGLVSMPIRVNSKIKEAPERGLTIFEYAKSSRGAKDYLKLAQRVIEAESSH